MFKFRQAAYNEKLKDGKINGPSKYSFVDWTRKPISHMSKFCCPGIDHSLINRQVLDRSLGPLLKLVKNLEVPRLETGECISRLSVSLERDLEH